MKLKAKEKRLLRQADPETASYLNSLLQYLQELEVVHYQRSKENKRLEQEYQRYSQLLAKKTASVATADDVESSRSNQTP
jgi:hypothetical protein